jgi:hypothetical protein
MPMSMRPMASAVFEAVPGAPPVLGRAAAAFAVGEGDGDSVGEEVGGITHSFVA